MTISPERRWLIVMVKEPRPGRVKTRLGRDISMVAAACWYRHQVARTLRVVRDPRWQLVLAVAPDRTAGTRFWPGDLPRLPQGPGNLGDRMGRVFRSLPPGPALIVGSDIPGITRSRVWDAFQTMRGADGVVGPAADGGYWLIGLRRQRPVPHALFRGVRWSGPYAMADTLATMGDLRIARTAMLADVDTAADLT